MGFFNWQTLRPRKMSMAGMNCRFVRNQAGRPERDYEAHQLCPVNYGLLKVGGWWWFLGCQNFCIWQFWKWSLQKVDDWMTWSNSSSPPRHGYSRHPKASPETGLCQARHVQADRWGEGDIDIDDSNGIGVLDDTQRGDWKSWFFEYPLFSCTYYVYIYIHCICTWIFVYPLLDEIDLLFFVYFHSGFSSAYIMWD